MQHVIDSLAPILLQETIYGQTFVTNISVSQWDYSLQVDNITVSKLAGPTIKVFQQNPDDDHLHIAIGGLNATLDLACKFTALHIVPITATQVTL